MTDIVRIGRRHLAIHGPAALSLRAVARDLGIVSSAVYRYVGSRDEMLTLLVADAYTELSDAVDFALSAAPADPAVQLRVLGRAVRKWALAEPARYSLLFGTPTPGYDAPVKQTGRQSARVIVAMLGVLDNAFRTGGIAEPKLAPPVSFSLAGDFASIREEFGHEMPDWLLARGISVWMALIGAVSFDVFHWYGTDRVGDRSEIFEYHLDNVSTLAGLTGDGAPEM
ncbi:TetR/AcrR family transcriptional regulator [Nocardia tengchongensis]|uniref:TetR/AcrR family transcriptional regulator n=1 Tax=Nocardia tengchongensis TaxID=2055889 RepID=UPI00369D5CA5